MKELSIGEKAKRYDEALHKAKRIINVCVDDNTECRSMIACIQQIFPELKESEERILKQLRDFFKNHINSVYEEIDDNNDVLAWLEKQGERKPVIEMKTPEESLGIDSDTYNEIVDECIYGEQKSADIEEVNFFDDFRKTDSEVEPKFKVGDWVVYDHNAYQVVELPKEGYINLGLKRNGKIEFAPSTYCRPWTIQDAKDGDVLAVTMYPEGTWIGIFKEYTGCTFSSYCFVNTEGTFKLGTCNHGNGKAIHPATKEQRDTLTKAMADAGYTFDFDKKELKEIEQKSYGWSEEDEDMCYKAIAVINRLCAEGKDYVWSIKTLKKLFCWLKSLRLQNRWISIDKEVYVKEPILAQKKDKSDQFGGFVVCCDHTLTPNVYERYMILGNIVSQNTWKPSEEQMKFLSKCIEAYNEVTFPTEVRVLSSLYNDLKKLKG